MAAHFQAKYARPSSEVECFRTYIINLCTAILPLYYPYIKQMPSFRMVLLGLADISLGACPISFRGTPIIQVLSHPHPSVEQT